MLILVFCEWIVYRVPSVWWRLITRSWDYGADNDVNAIVDLFDVVDKGLNPLVYESSLPICYISLVASWGYP